MTARTVTATAMAFRDQRRRPLLLIVLVIFPAYAVTRGIAVTQPTPRQIGLPGGLTIVTTMKDIHGAVMAGMAIAFVAALCGVFIMQAAIQGDRRLVLAGFRPFETILARIAVLAAATTLVVVVSLVVTGLNFTPNAWLPFAAAGILTGLTYAALGALAGAVLDSLAATYLMLFLVLTDLGIVQNPMFGSGNPRWWAGLLPGFGATRVMVDAAFAPGFHAPKDLLVALAWAVASSALVAGTLSRAVSAR